MKSSSSTVSHDGRSGDAAWADLRSIALAALLSSSVAWAQQPPAQVIDEGLRRQAERERAQQETLQPRRDDLRPPSKATTAPAMPTEQPCFVLRDIALNGPDAWRFKWLQSSTEPFIGRCIGAQGISRIASYLDALLIEQGYVTSRIGIGQQNLAEGRLELRLHTGRIAQVRMVDGALPGNPADDRWGTWINAFPTRAGRLLNAHDLEQGVEQMKRLPSQEVTTTLTPGSDADTSIVTIERRAGSLRERLHGGLTLDNSGSAALGRAQASINLALDNPFGINDILSVSLNSNAQQLETDHRSQSASLNYSLPVGYSTFTASTSHSRFAQNVQLTTTTTLSSGASDTRELKWQHIVYRSASAKTGLRASLSTRRSSSYLDDTELVTQRRRTSFFEIGANLKQLFPRDASIEIEAGYRRGVPWVRAEEDLQPDPFAPGAVPTLRPHLYTLNATLRWPFAKSSSGAWPERSFELGSSLRAQYTHDHTLSVDQIGIAGRNTVRGFDGDAVLLAESGWVWRNDLTLPLDIAGTSGGALYLGLDAGRVWGASDTNLIGHFLAGTAVGLRGRLAAWSALQLDAALAKPLVMPDRFKTRRLSVYVSATCSF